MYESKVSMINYAKAKSSGPKISETHVWDFSLRMNKQSSIEVFAKACFKSVTVIFGIEHN